MIRKIIHIDEEKCVGCGLCASACHEGAIDIVDGKAKLVRENFCDGFGDCLPECPTGAISFEEREAPEYDEEAVKKAKEEKAAQTLSEKHEEKEAQSRSETEQAGGQVRVQKKAVVTPIAPAAHGCPGSMAREIRRENMYEAWEDGSNPAQDAPNCLTNWPVQIKLAPTQAPYFAGADLLIAADCTAYAYANFHRDFIKGRVALIGCPKLDAIDYSEKLTEIIRCNDIKSVTIVRMEVPCCGGLERAVQYAIAGSGRAVEYNCVIVGIDGTVC